MIFLGYTSSFPDFLMVSESYSDLIFELIVIAVEINGVYSINLNYAIRYAIC